MLAARSWRIKNIQGVNASGFRVFIVENLTLEVGRTVSQNFKQTWWHPTRQSARRRTFSLRLRDEVERVVRK